MGPRDQVPVDVRVLYTDHAGRMWMGSPEGIAIWDHGRVTKITQKDGLPGNYVMSILEDHQGVVWVGTITGLARLDHRKVTAYPTAEGLLSNYIQSLHEDAEGTLWFCTPSGLHRFKNGRFRAFTTKDGMFADSTLQLLEDDQRRFWISSFRGIFRVSRDDLNAVADGARTNVESVGYGTEDGMKSSACGGLGMQPAGWKTRNGTLWFPTDQGVVSVDPSNLLAPLPPPSPILEGILADGVATSDTRMSPEYRRIDFVFAAPSPSSQSQLSIVTECRATMTVGISQGLNTRSRSRIFHKGPTRFMYLPDERAVPGVQTWRVRRFACSPTSTKRGRSILEPDWLRSCLRGSRTRFEWEEPRGA